MNKQGLLDIYSDYLLSSFAQRQQQGWRAYWMER